MARGGYRAGSGRPKKGEKSVSDEIAEIVKRYDDPVEYMLDVMNDPNVDAQRRDRMAIAAAPFIRARAAETGKKETKAEAAKKASEGKFAPSAPPRLVVSNS